MTCFLAGVEKDMSVSSNRCSVVEKPKGLLLSPEGKEKELENARRLLKEQEKDLPENVVKVVEYFTLKRIGFILSRNQHAGNCRDARYKRNRIGHAGIPLYDELKSFVGVSKDKNGREQIVAMHCRAHLAMDLERVVKVCDLQNEIAVLPEADLQKKYNIEFGTVNPVLLEIKSNHKVLHVFDNGVLEPVSRFPGTMMTNAGNHTWGIEFDPGELVGSIENSIIDTIAIPDTELEEFELPKRLNPKSIGIITGNGPDSGMALWQDINENIAEILGKHFIGDISLPKVFVVSVPAMGLSMELDQREQVTWQALSEAVTQLKDLNVDLLALACHTTHYFTGKIREIFEGDGRKFISMPEVVIKYIAENNITELAVLGINYVADMDRWSAYSELKKYKIEKLNYETIRKFHDLGYLVKQMNQRYKGFQQLVGLMKNEVKSNNIIIALTELSILLQSQGKKNRPSDKNIIDALELYAKAIAEESLGMTD
jgi:aspartate/glutamate racemase